MKIRFRKIMAAILSTAMVAAAIPASGILNVQAKSPQEHIDLSRQVAGEGMVLMENDGALPLAQGEKVAMFGRAMIDYVRGGGGSGATNVDYTHNILQGMQIKEEEGKVTLYQPLVDFYTKQVSEKGIKNDANITVTDDMLNAAADDIAGNVAQAIALEQAGCQMVRVAIPNKNAVALIPAIKEAVTIPLVADIHFDYRLALEAVAAGIDKIRINPGNIGSDDRVKAVAEVCREKNIPIRIGVNSGSVEKEILKKYGGPTPQALCESALHHASLLEKFDFTDIVLSIKSSNVDTMIKAYELTAQQCEYPLHLGVTEAGTERMGLIKSAVGIGSLLQRGIGDTIRVSLTADPVKEIAAGKDILKALDLDSTGPQMISCPSCGRTKIDLIGIANEVEQRLRECDKPLKVAVMGCAVNGPGEAKEADIGIAGGDGVGLIFKKGEVIKKVPEDILIDTLMEEILKM